ncbi:3'(2'),5'-bisphosphate nucleotidase CysQ [Fulvivirgaceae bacterium BMA12]|uniref:3'(2'),5'-bisphosphate nucleotidase CysQ n=1 Tax=Agaribacillus aureus TaxID=3051825 RepID=A0ABT8LFJ8_9BACT|nr:3'(2'),5'-bisphosphate nucleotidase CysQ [Fulvivirgaceae bacterium BMA12]
MQDTINIDVIRQIAREAGKEILRIYNDSDFSQVVDFKDDNSPLTLADKASHQVIVKALNEAYPNIPIISEEGSDVPYDQRKEWSCFWLVDPLDGTKEFIKRNGEFTVNIALIKEGNPVMGVVYTPVTDELYEGSVGYYARKIQHGDISDLQVNKKDGNRIAVRSKSHPSKEEEQILNDYNVVDSISVGSSLKFCMLAEGKADIYYRHGPTMEWDTAAGQAVLEAAGGAVYKNTGDEIFTYNKESLLNGSFLCLG